MAGDAPGGSEVSMTVMLIWTLAVDPARLDEARALVATRREQVRRHSCRDLRVYLAAEGEHAGTRAVAIEEFESRADLEALRVSQPLDAEVQATIAETFAPTGPFAVIDMVVVDELATPTTSEELP